MAHLGGGLAHQRAAAAGFCTHPYSAWPSDARCFTAPLHGSDTAHEVWVGESAWWIDAPMVTAYLHDGPRDGETIGMPWARYELELLRWVGDLFEEIVSDTYRLRPPWRGQSVAHFDFVPTA